MYGTLDGIGGRIVDARFIAASVAGVSMRLGLLCVSSRRLSLRRVAVPYLRHARETLIVLLRRRQHKCSGGDRASARFAM